MKVLTTPRLSMVPLQVCHAAQVFGALQDERIYTYISDSPPNSLVSLEERFRFLETPQSPGRIEIWANWIAALRENGESVGWFQATIHDDATAQIAYIIFPEYWARGYAREACRRMVEYLFDDVGCSRIVASMDTENSRSVRLVESLGFKKKALLRNAATIRGRRSDEFQYELGKSEHYLLGKIEAAEGEIADGKGISHVDAKKNLGKWL